MHRLGGAPAPLARSSTGSDGALQQGACNVRHACLPEERHGRDAPEDAANDIGACRTHDCSDRTFTSGCTLDHTTHGNDGPTVELPPRTADDASSIGYISLGAKSLAR